MLQHDRIRASEVARRYNVQNVSGETIVEFTPDIDW